MIDFNYLELRWNMFKAKFFGEENGAVDLIVIIILIAIVLVLAIAFRKKIAELISDIFNSAGDSANQAASGAGQTFEQLK